MKYMICLDGSPHSVKALEFLLKILSPQDSLLMYSCFSHPDVLVDVSEALIVQPVQISEDVAQAEAERRKHDCMEALKAAQKKAEVSTL
jgi:hypothetical protein